MTAPDLTTRLAEVLAAHAVMTAQHINTKHPVIQCKCGGEVTGGSEKWREHQAEMLAAVVRDAQREASAQAFQAVRDNAEYEPEERDGPHLIIAAYLMIDVDKLNALDKSHDGMDWVRCTATDYANTIREREAEAWDAGRKVGWRDGHDVNPYRSNDE